VFDKGNMKDGEGRDIDFKNTVIMMTTNAGTEFIKNLCSDPIPCRPGCVIQSVFPELLKTFKRLPRRLTSFLLPLSEE